MASITKLTKAQLINKIDELSSNYAELSEKFEQLQSANAELQAQAQAPKTQAPAPKPMTLTEQAEFARKSQTAIQAVAFQGIRVWVDPAQGGLFTFRHCPEGQVPRITRLMTQDDLRTLYTKYRANKPNDPATKAKAPAAKPAEAMSHLA